VVPVYSISFNGRVGVGEAKFGKTFGEIPVKKIAKFLMELAELKVNSGSLDFVEFIQNKEMNVRELVTKYSSIESFSENADLYSDL